MNFPVFFFFIQYKLSIVYQRTLNVIGTFLCQQHEQEMTSEISLLQGIC